MSAGVSAADVRSLLLDELSTDADRSDEEVLDLIDTLVMRAGKEQRLSLGEKEALRREIFNSVRRLDILQELVEDPAVTEIMVNGPENVFYEKEGRIRRWDRCFASRGRLEDVIRQIAGSCNRIVNEQRPIADARLPDGARVNIVLPPAALNGPILTIRRFPEQPVTMEKLVRLESLTQEAADFLGSLVRARYSIMIGGATSTGKTTFLNALSAYIPPGERIVTIEDNAELQIQGVDDLVRLEARDRNMEGDFAITIRDLIRTALRMRPDRIIIGEIRGAEAEDFLICLNTGHDGSLGTAHANSVRDMISRLEMMTLMSQPLPVPVIRRQIAAGVQILVHLKRDADGRRKTEEIAEITGMQGDEIEIRTLFARDDDGTLRQKEALLHTRRLSEHGQRT